MAEAKYHKYILKEPKSKGPPERHPTAQGITITEEMMAPFGVIDCNFNFVGILQPHVLADPPHKHDCDELLFFIPGDPSIAPALGGEMEVALGEGWEKQVINTAAVICVPKGVQHCPVYVKRVDKPFYFGHCLLQSKYGSSATPAV
jgi:hypothetical protein